MPDPDPPPEQHRRALLLLADEVAGWHAELGAPRAEAALTAALELLGHALVDLADGRHPQPRQAATHRPGGRGGTRDAGGSPGPDRAACSALAARLRRLGREAGVLAPADQAAPVAATAAALAGAVQEHAQLLAGGARPAPSAVRWLAPRLAAAAGPLRSTAGAGSSRDGADRPGLR